VVERVISWGRGGAPSNARSWLEKEENTEWSAPTGSSSFFREPGEGFWMTMPPHCGSKNAYDVDGVSTTQRYSAPADCVSRELFYHRLRGFGEGGAVQMV
jgi:hypothetical protein